MYKLSSGFFYLIDGFRLITKPGLKRYVVIPLFINIILFTGLFFFLRHYLREFNAWINHFLPAWLHWLDAIFWLIFLLGFIFILIYTFVALANIVSAPFNSLLAEKVELYLTGNMLPERTWIENIKDVPRIVGRQFAILGYYLPRALVLFILFFIPVIQAIAPILWFLFNAWYLSLIFMDYPTDNHRIPIPEVRTWLKAPRGLSLSFGMSILVVSMIPILNFFAVPASVAAATKIWLDETKRKD